MRLLECLGPRHVKRHLAISFLRVGVGVAQMTMALVTLGLYFQEAASPWIYGSLAVTMLLVLGSRLAFADRQTEPRISFSMKKYTCEFLGTFTLVFAGTGAIVINDVSGGTVSHVGVALTFGLVVMAMIYTFGDISGAHLNPAVTLGFIGARRMPVSEGLAYIGSQILGAMAASGTLHLLFPLHRTLGLTQPAGSALQSFEFEFLLTAILMLVILNVSVGAKEKGITAGIAIGGVIALEALFAGPICGASMNPARSLGPALLTANFNALWIYILAPITGALFAVPLCMCVREPGCCRNTRAGAFDVAG
jgi:aquaporin NIP